MASSTEKDPQKKSDTPLLTATEIPREKNHDIKIKEQALKTYAAIGKNFPEAVPHLPSPTSTSLTIPIEDIRKKLNSFK